MIQIKFEYNKSIPFSSITVYVLLMSVFTLWLVLNNDQFNQHIIDKTDKQAVKIKKYLLIDDSCLCFLFL